MKTPSPYDLIQLPKVCTCNGSPYTICVVCMKKRRESATHQQGGRQP